jgi:hypothetical protein
MRHDRGLAASPLVRYTLRMESREHSPFPYPPSMSPPFARRQRRGAFFQFVDISADHFLKSRADRERRLSRDHVRALAQRVEVVDPSEIPHHGIENRTAADIRLGGGRQCTAGPGHKIAKTTPCKVSWTPARSTRAALRPGAREEKWPGARQPTGSG